MLHFIIKITYQSILAPKVSCHVHFMKIVDIASILVHIELTPLYAHHFLKFHHHKKL
jgi:hypothetical protein